MRTATVQALAKAAGRWFTRKGQLERGISIIVRVQGEVARTYLAGANLISKVSTQPLQESKTGGRSHPRS